jgi:hypothetical protein
MEGYVKTPRRDNPADSIKPDYGMHDPQNLTLRPPDAHNIGSSYPEQAFLHVIAHVYL